MIILNAEVALHKNGTRECDRSPILTNAVNKWDRPQTIIIIYVSTELLR